MLSWNIGGTGAHIFLQHLGFCIHRDYPQIHCPAVIHIHSWPKNGQVHVIEFILPFDTIFVTHIHESVQKSQMQC